MQDERVDKIEERLGRLEDKFHAQDKQSLKDKFELANLITKAVVDGNKETASLFEKLEIKFEGRFDDLNKRTCELENQDAKKSQLVLKIISKAVITTTIGWVVLGFLNNYLALTTDKIKKDVEEVPISEVIKKDN